jgi:hypothetical protein
MNDLPGGRDAGLEPGSQPAHAQIDHSFDTDVEPAPPLRLDVPVAGAPFDGPQP